MYVLMVFDTEDFLSAPDAPVHRLPAQFAGIMARYGLKGCFHLIGEKVRFMVRHRQSDILKALCAHDVSLHTDRGSMHPTTVEAISGLDWPNGVDHALFREQPGVQTLETVFGRCSSLSKHGGTFAAQLVYAAGRMGKPFFQNPFELPGRAVGWYCNNLIIGIWGGGSFDLAYRDTPLFEQKMTGQRDYLIAQQGKLDLVSLFGCHPVKTVMQDYPCANFYRGAMPPVDQWKPPVMYPGVSIPLILKNFERRIAALADFPGIEWATVGGIANRYRTRPVRVSDAQVCAGADAVLANRGPTFTQALSAGELLFLLARRRLAPSADYPVPQVMGPIVDDSQAVNEPLSTVDLDGICHEIIDAVDASGYLPASLATGNRMTCEAALWLLSAAARDLDPNALPTPRLTLEAIPGVPGAIENVRGCRNWRVHGPLYRQENILKHFIAQTWTYKPAYEAADYPDDVETGTALNPSLPFRST